MYLVIDVLNDVWMVEDTQNVYLLVVGGLAVGLFYGDGLETQALVVAETVLADDSVALVDLAECAAA